MVEMVAAFAVVVVDVDSSVVAGITLVVPVSIQTPDVLSKLACMWVNTYRISISRQLEVVLAFACLIVLPN